MSHANSNVWAFDLSSFLTLLGEREEFNYRLMRRSLCECLSAAPVVGLQTYIISHDILENSQGITYLSPTGAKSAPLRNLRLANTIETLGLLRDSKCSIYRIPYSQDPGNSVKSLPLFLWTLFTWIYLGGVVVTLLIVPGSSWIGILNCTLLPTWGIIVRLLEHQFTTIATTINSRPDRDDSVIFLGRRTSFLVIEGRREDVCRWTGLGIQMKSGRLSKFVLALLRATTFLILVSIFVIITNGTLSDQIAFIAINLLGQANVKLGLYLNAKACIQSLETVVQTEAQTRTHLYGFLIRKFGNDDWVDNLSLLPKGPVWRSWRNLVFEDSCIDPKEAYMRCLTVDLEKNNYKLFDDEGEIAKTIM